MATDGTVVVASGNPGKVQAAREAFEAVWPGCWTVTSCAVDSGVSDQPSTEDETIRGAWNRALAARSASSADFAVGMEGGMVDGGMECGWVVVLDGDGRAGIAATARIMLPPAFRSAMAQGMPLDTLCSAALGTDRIGQGVGYFGLMTNNAVTRPSAYRDAVAFALAPFVHPELFAGDMPAVAMRGDGL